MFSIEMWRRPESFVRHGQVLDEVLLYSSPRVHSNDITLNQRLPRSRERFENDAILDQGFARLAFLPPPPSAALDSAFPPLLPIFYEGDYPNPWTDFSATTSCQFLVSSGSGTFHGHRSFRVPLFPAGMITLHRLFSKVGHCEHASWVRGRIPRRRFLHTIWNTPSLICS